VTNALVLRQEFRTWDECSKPCRLPPALTCHWLGDKHQLAAELVDRGIRVNAARPGPIDTLAGFECSGLSKEAIEEFARNIGNNVAMKQLGQPEEIAGAVAFLASSDVSFMTVAEIPVDGGLGQI
jgi:NAD(P)-dependent dehydrogenase (short-subunit alcohol dehydrogenase family)